MKKTCHKCIDKYTTIFIFGDDNDMPTEFCINHLDDAMIMYEKNKIKYPNAKWVKNAREVYERGSDTTRQV